MFFVLSDDCVDTDEIRVAGGAVDGAAGEDNIVARLQVQRLLCRLSRVVEQHVGRLEMLTQNRLYAPRERQLVAMPTISVGTRKRETMRTVLPDSELTTIAFAPMSIAMPQVAWEMASSRLRIWNFVLRKRVS